MAVKKSALRPFRMARRTQGRSHYKQQVRRMASRSYDPSHRRHHDLRLSAAVFRAVQHALHLYRHWLALDQPIHQRNAPHSDGRRRPCRRRAVRPALGALPGHRHVLDDAALGRRDARGGGRRAVRHRGSRLLPRFRRVHDVLHRGVHLDSAVPTRPRPVVQHGAGAQQRDRHRNRRTRAAGDRFDESRGSGRAADSPNHRHQRAALRRRHAGLASAPEGGHEAAERTGQQGDDSGSAGNITPGQAAVGECTPAASNTTPGSDGSDTSVQRAADGMPEAAEGPTPGAAPSADDAAIDPEVHHADFAGRFSLTPREIEVLVTVTADERPLKHVAADMGISLRVLQRHLTSLYQKTGTQSRVGLTKLFWE
ncbi:helix-turn-helix transcriptional regulator [Adlercreutzia equolifaciens]|uniref:helix-turn-helix transcriptional regulator n=1 Tax=Adlercreutzia equolifaciens TaxID=446660 RepID=UPI003467BB23